MKSHGFLGIYYLNRNKSRGKNTSYQKENSVYYLCSAKFPTLTVKLSLSNLVKASTNLKTHFLILTRHVGKKESQNHDFNTIIEKQMSNDEPSLA